MIDSLRLYWSYKKFQHFTFVHICLIIGILTVPVDIWYLYDLLIFRFVTFPMTSTMGHLYFNHNYIIFRNSIAKIIGLTYITLTNFWKFTDVKSYHITHHKSWLSDKDPTAIEVRQGICKHYIGITNPTPIQLVNTKQDNILVWFNSYFFIIKIVGILALILLLGWKLFVHLIIIQQFLMYFSLKAQDQIYHSDNFAKDQPWLFVIYGSDAWHIEHHHNYEKMITWRFKYIDPQYLLTKLFFKQHQSE